jgi:K(+)-stimulated pyrophosphate-energized sodium pump
MRPFFAAAALLWQVLPDTALVSTSSDRMYLWIALGVGVFGLLAALLFARSVLASDTGTPEMRAISDAIREGAEAFMRRQ